MMKFILWIRQTQFLDVLHTYKPKRVIILKKRQTGISQLTGADSLAQCMILEGFTVLILSKSGPDAKEYLKRVSDMYKTIPEELRVLSPLIKDTQEEMMFQNGSRLVSLPANRGAGFTADRVIIDEAAFITRSETKIDLKTVFQRVEPTLDKSEGQLILISTANGNNLFARYYRRAKAELSNYKAFFFSCYDDPTFSEAKRLEIIKDNDEDHANQEYPRTDTEAFLSSGRPRFNIQKLEEYQETKLYEVKLRGDMDLEDNITENPKGYIKFFRKYKPDGQYIIIADVAEGLEHGDYSCGKVIDLITWEQVAEWHGHIEHNEFGTELVKLARHYNNAVIVVENNNHGNSTITQIRKVELYPEELIFESNYAKEKADDDFKTPEKRFGWMTTVRTKKVIIDNLAKLLNDGMIPGLTEDDIDELSTYVIDAKGATNAEDDCFDDRVMTLAIAYYVIQFIEIQNKPHTAGCESCEFFQANLSMCLQTKRKACLEQWCRLFSLFTFEKGWYKPESKRKSRKRRTKTR